MIVEAWLACLLNNVTSILEAIFASGPSSYGGNDTDDHSNHHNTRQSAQAKDAALAAAFEFFEVSSPEEATREVMKKKFRKLSLLHHPDRNGNSEESKVMMQRVNNYYLIITEELDRREGVTHDDDDNDEPEDPNNNEPEETSSAARRNSSSSQAGQSSSSNSRKKRKGKSRRKPKSNKKKNQRWKEEMEEEMDEEMRQYWAQVSRQKNAMRRKRTAEKQKVQRTVRKHNLDTVDGRENANREWEEAIKKMEKEEQQQQQQTKERQGPSGSSPNEASPTDGSPLHDIDDDNENGTPSTPELSRSESSQADSPCSASSPEPSSPTGQSSSTPKKKKKKKPVNLVMDCNTDDIAVALRMKMTDVAIDAVQDGIEKVIVSVMMKAMYNEEDFPIRAIHKATAKYFLRPLDDDGNTLLHYAVYYESTEVISLVLHMASKYKLPLPRIVLKENHYQQIPLDFAKCCVYDTSIPQRMQGLTDAAKEELDQRKLGPTLKKSLQRLSYIVRHTNVVACLDFVAAYYGVGRCVFGTGRITSLLFACIALTGRAEADEAGMVIAAQVQVGFLFGLHLSWPCYRVIYAWLGWQYYLILIPLALFCFGGISGFLIMLPAIMKIFSGLLTGLAERFVVVPKVVKKRRLETLYLIAVFSAVVIGTKALVTWEVANEEGVLEVAEKEEGLGGSNTTTAVEGEPEL